MTEIRPHALSAAEEVKLRVALESLPALNLDALRRHLHQLAFVDGVPGEGNGLVGPAADKTQYDMAIRASIFRESLSEFLTKKNSFVFVDDHSGVNVTVTGSGTDTLTYVLLHESTHILDRSCGLTTQSQTRFGANIWASSKRLSGPLRKTLVAQTHFRGKPGIPLQEAPELYASLAKSPFVSLYATANAQEDLAELVTHREIAMNNDGGFTISVQVPGQPSALVWHPLMFPAVKARFAQVDALEAFQEGCPAASSSRRF